MKHPVITQWFTYFALGATAGVLIELAVAKSIWWDAILAVLAIIIFLLNVASLIDHYKNNR